MTLLRPHLSGLAAAAACSHLLLWLALALSPCLMAMPSMKAAHHADGGRAEIDMASSDMDHDCGHCPPVACDQIQADLLSHDCDNMQTLVAPGSPQDDIDANAVSDYALAVTPAKSLQSNSAHYSPPRWAGPRRHLLHLKFNE